MKEILPLLIQYAILLSARPHESMPAVPNAFSSVKIIPEFCLTNDTSSLLASSKYVTSTKLFSQASPSSLLFYSCDSQVPYTSFLSCSVLPLLILKLQNEGLSYIARLYDFFVCI